MDLYYKPVCLYSVYKKTPWPESASELYRDRRLSATLVPTFADIVYVYIYNILKLVVCILLRVLGQVQGFRLTQHWFE
jgi:hypothetical protein